MNDDGTIQAPDGEQGDIAGVDAFEKDGPVRSLRAGVPTMPGEHPTDDPPARLPEDVEERFTIR